MSCHGSDPDLMAGDGIYSRYLTGLPSPGWYRVAVTMRNMGETAYTVAGHEQLHPQPPGYLTPTCCGSAVRVPPQRRRYLGYFNREVVMSIFISNKDMVDSGRIPPARIIDLTILESHSYYVIVSWTAPADDSIDNYLVTVFSDVDKALGEGATGDVIAIANNTKKGDKHVCKIEFGNFTSESFIGVRAVSAGGYIGKISNLVEVDLLQSLPIPDAGHRGEKETVKYLVIVATVTVISIIIVILTIVMVRRKEISPNMTKTKSHGVTAILS